MSDLKPCPFCGGRPIWEYCTEDRLDIRCDTCGITFEEGFRNRAEAIEAWNRRADDHFREVTKMVERTAKVESRKWRKDLTLIGGGSWSGKCQECGRWVKSNECTYCPRCGSRLNWGE